jgi:Nucleotidyl transferase AbiEii toxin, Type IV TA system
MSAEFLHNHPQFADLIRIVAEQKGIDPALVEKDYWIMHCLYGLQQLGLTFELKGGTSLSKGFQIIDRFSEDIDIRVEPPEGRDVKTGRNQNKRSHIQSRRDFYDWLAKTIRINGIEKVERDAAFDNRTLMSGGIRLFYKSYTEALAGLRSGVLLELGFDDVTPNRQKDIGSWLYDYAAGKVDIIDNRAKGVACYDPGYTFAEKLQTVSTKFRQQQVKKDSPIEFMCSSARMPTRRTRSNASAAAIILTSPKTRPSSWPIPKRAMPTPRHSLRAPHSITATNRPLNKSSLRSVNGSIACEDVNFGGMEFRVLRRRSALE